MAQIKNAEWSKVYICKNADMDACHKCRRRIQLGAPYQFVGGWNTTIVWCSLCGHMTLDQVSTAIETFKAEYRAAVEEYQTNGGTKETDVCGWAKVMMLERVAVKLAM